MSVQTNPPSTSPFGRYLGWLAKPFAGRAWSGKSSLDMAADGPKTRASRAASRRYFPLIWLTMLGTLAILSLAMPAFIAVLGRDALGLIMGVVAAQTVLVLVLAGLRQRGMAAMLAVAGFVGLLTLAVVLTGGLTSPLLILYAYPPIEASMVRRRSVANGVAVITLAGALPAALLAMPSGQAWDISPSQVTMMAVLGILYGLSLAARVARSNALRELKTQAGQRAIQQFHTITHDVFLILRRDGQVGRVFGAISPVLDCEAADLIGRGLVERVHVADRPAFLTALDDACAQSARKTVDVRLQAGRDERRFLWAEIDLSTVQVQGDECEVYALVRDVTAAKERTAEITRAREKAEASDAAKGRFLATMSHELRTPLNAIIGFADILDEEVFGALANDQQREYVGLIRESGGHLLQLVNDLLDMSKLDAGHFHIVAEPFKVTDIVQRSARLVREQFHQASVNLAVDVPAAMPELVADQRAVRQILLNLLSNACKFTPAGGRVVLRVMKDRQACVLSVADTGIGIATNDLGRIGEPFFQANNTYDRAHQGTGLGLSVVKGLCELHEGSMHVASVEGEGTTVTVRLPLSGPKLGAQPASLDTKRANTVVFGKLERERADQLAPKHAVKPTERVAETRVDEDVEERKWAHG